MRPVKSAGLNLLGCFELILQPLLDIWGYGDISTEVAVEREERERQRLHAQACGARALGGSLQRGSALLTSP